MEAPPRHRSTYPSRGDPDPYTARDVWSERPERPIAGGYGGLDRYDMVDRYDSYPRGHTYERMAEPSRRLDHTAMRQDAYYAADHDLYGRSADPYPAPVDPYTQSMDPYARSMDPYGIPAARSVNPNIGPKRPQPGQLLQFAFHVSILSEFAYCKSIISVVY